MFSFDDIFCILYNFFDFLSFRTKTIHDGTKDDEEEYEFIIGEQTINRY